MSEEWVNNTIEGMREIAQALNLGHCEFISRDGKLSEGLAGAYIPVVGDRANVQLAVLSSAQGNRNMARSLLQMDPDDADLTSEDVADAVCEISNMLAGRVKAGMAQKEPGLRLGLPVFIDGRLEEGNARKVNIVQMSVANDRVSVMVMTNA